MRARRPISARLTAECKQPPNLYTITGDYFASGSDDKMVYIWKTNFDEVDEQLGIGPKSGGKKESKVKYSIENPELLATENEEPTKGILKEKSINSQQTSASAGTDSELAKLNAKMDMMMKTLVVMDKRLTLVEDQLRVQKN